MITRDRDNSGILGDPEGGGVPPQIKSIKTKKEAFAAIPHPELPIIIVPQFSIDSDGNIVWENRPGLPGWCLINGGIEDVLRAIAPVAAITNEFPSPFGEGILEVNVAAVPAAVFAQDSIGRPVNERTVSYIGSQDSEGQRKQLEELGIKGVSIFFGCEQDAKDFGRLLKPETNRTLFLFTDCTLPRLIVWFGEAEPISVIIRTS